MTELKMEHILMVLIAGFVLYHFMGGCGCLRRGNGFRVGAFEWSNPGKFIGEDIFRPIAHGLGEGIFKPVAHGLGEVEEGVFKPMAHGFENVWEKESQHLTPQMYLPLH